MIREEALRVGIEPAALLALVAQESQFEWWARSSVGAQGLTQLMPETAYETCPDLFPRGSDLLQTRKNARCGARYLAIQLRTFRGFRCALYAYNAGPGSAMRSGCSAPNEDARLYADKVLRYYWLYRFAEQAMSNCDGLEESAFEACSHRRR